MAALLRVIDGLCAETKSNRQAVAAFFAYSVAQMPDF
jgi:hypothetical protein